MSDRQDTNNAMSGLRHAVQRKNWGDYRDLLPGFSRLNNDDASIVFHNTLGIDFKRAMAKSLIDGRSETKIEPGIGFVELLTGDGKLEISKELKRIFVYSFSKSSFDKLRNLAAIIVRGANWGNDSLIVNKGRLLTQEDVPYYDLGVELKPDYLSVKEREYSSAQNKGNAPYFVEDLLAYYNDRMDKHSNRLGELGQKQGQDRSEGLINYEGDSFKGSWAICAALLKLLERGVYRLVAAKALEANYEAVHRQLASLPELGNEKVRPFKRTFPYPEQIKDTANPPIINEVLEDVSTEQVSDDTGAQENISQALLHVTQKLKEVGRANEQDSAASKDANPDLLLEAYKNLKFLQKNDVTWVGYSQGMDDATLLGNARKIKTYIETNGSISKDNSDVNHIDQINSILAQKEQTIVSASAVPLPDLSSLPINEEIAVIRENGAIDDKALEVAYVDKLDGVLPASPTPIESEKPTLIDEHEEETAANKLLQADISEKWKRARSIFGWAKRNAPALIVGGVAGSAVRIGAQFALAAIITTTPGVLATVGTVLLAGALAGGVSKCLTTALFDSDKKSEKNWQYKAFLRGMALGSAGGLIGAGITQLAIHDGLLGAWVHHLKTPLHHPINPHHPTVAPVAKPGVVQSSGRPLPQASGTGTAPRHVVQRPSAQLAPIPHHPPAHISGNSAKAMLTERQLKNLPRGIRRLASSRDPQKIAQFCKEASFRLINHGHNAEAKAAGARLLEYGVQMAQQAGLHNPVVSQLHADLAYVKMWGIGAGKSMPEAIRNARLSNSAVHGYGSKLLKFLKCPSNT